MTKPVHACRRLLAGSTSLDFSAPNITVEGFSIGQNSTRQMQLNASRQDVKEFGSQKHKMPLDGLYYQKKNEFNELNEFFHGYNGLFFHQNELMSKR